MKKNSPDKVEVIDVTLDPIKHPIAYRAKLDDLKNAGFHLEDAVAHIAQNPIQLELYYSEGLALWAVESEAVESCEIMDPFSHELLEEDDDE